MLEQRDIDNENALATIFGQHYGVICHRYCQYSPVDYWLEHRGRLAGHLECRCRGIPKDAYETVIFDVTKYISLLNMQHVTGLPCYIAVRWTDDVGVFRVRAAHLATAPIERMSREGFDQCQPVVFLPIGQFELI